MEIIDKYLNESTLTILFDEVIQDGVKVDVSINNAENHYRNVENKKYDLFKQDVVAAGRSIEITIPSDMSALLVITVTIDGVSHSTLFLNKYMLFKAQNKHLAMSSCGNSNNTCEGCGEKIWRTKTLAILLRTRLLDYAYTNDLIDDAIKLYVDLTRVLDFKHITFESIPVFYNNINTYVNELV